MVALVGCSDDPEPRTLPPVPSASPSPSVVPMPSEAAAETPEGAAAFARYFFAVVNAGLESGDAGHLRKISSPDCGGCRSLASAIEEEPSAGERIVGGLFDVLSAESPPVDAGDVIVEVSYAVSEIKVYGSDGAILRSTAAVPRTNGQVRLLRNGQGWIVQGFRSIDS